MNFTKNQSVIHRNNVGSLTSRHYSPQQLTFIDNLFHRQALENSNYSFSFFKLCLAATLFQTFLFLSSLLIVSEKRFTGCSLEVNQLLKIQDSPALAETLFNKR